MAGRKKNKPGDRQAIVAPENRQSICVSGESEERFRDLVESMYDWIWEVDADNVYTYSSPRSLAVLGYRPEELLGRRPTELMTPEESQRVSEIIRRKCTERVPITHFECMHLHRDGHIVWVEVNALPVFHRDDTLAGYRGINRDITGSKRAEVSLRESEEKFRTLADTTAVAILVYQGENYIYANHSAESISGYSRDELLSMKFWDYMHPDDREMARERGMARLKGEMVPSRYEVRYRTKDGRDGIFEINASTICMNGQRAGLITALDITEHKRSETALKDAKSQAELYLDLMGHDINNMHQVALGYLELAAELEENDNMRELLERPRDVLLRSARLIDNVRKLQKLKDGIYLFRPIDLVRVLTDVVKEHEAVPGKVLTLDTHLNNAGYVQANELIYDVFSNLVSNAVKYSGSHARVTIGLSAVLENGCHFYRVSVEDNGPGVPDSFKLKVFNRMLQGDAGAKGMGLGLYIVKTLVDSYQGRVWVEDRVQGDHTRGAKFIVRLPALYKD
ncbi:MAG TPA: PAS domain-containing sensor histidine kinase [Methanocella sp.]